MYNAMANRWAEAGLLALVLTACGRNMQPEGRTTAAAPTGSPDGSPVASIAATGVIYVAGAEPITMVTLRSENTVLQLSGDLADELRRLSGARVEVRGEAAKAGPNKRVMVSDYTVLEIDGRRPWVGVITTSGNSLWLSGQDTVPLADSQGRLAPLAGGKVWVIADTTASPATVQAYGVIREAPR
jgi:hypothetical protein